MHNKPLVQYLIDTFNYGSKAYASSKDKASRVVDMYNGRQFTEKQLNTITKRKQIPIVLNYISKYIRLLTGHLASVHDGVAIRPRQSEDGIIAKVLSGVTKYVFEQNRFESLFDRVKEQAMITGLYVLFIGMEDTGETDQFGVPLRRVKLEFVPEKEIVLDPSSKQLDYSDANFIHRFVWATKENIITMLETKNIPTKKIKWDKLEEEHNPTDSTQASIDYKLSIKYKMNDRDVKYYQLVHSVIKKREDGKLKAYSIYWVGSEIIYKEDITKEVITFPYKVHKLKYDPNVIGYEGVFSELIPIQHAINRISMHIDFISNSSKVMYENGSVADINKFTQELTSITEHVKVSDLAGIKELDNSSMITHLSMIKDNLLRTMQDILGVNDSFLGITFASDSGTKVESQRKATITQLHYLTQATDTFHTLITLDIIELVKKYYKANQIIKIVDEEMGELEVVLNQPKMQVVGLDREGLPIQVPKLQISYDEVTGEAERNQEGDMVVRPEIEESTDLSFAKVDVTIEPVARRMEIASKVQKLQEVLASPTGQMIGQINPAGFLEQAKFLIKQIDPPEKQSILAVYDETIKMLKENNQEAGDYAGREENQQVLQSTLRGMSANSRTGDDT